MKKPVQKKSCFLDSKILETMYLKIKRIKAVPNSFGKNDLVVSMVQAIDENGKHIKHVRLTQELADRIKDSPILIEQTDDIEDILKKDPKDPSPSKVTSAGEQLSNKELDKILFNF